MTEDTLGSPPPEQPPRRFGPPKGFRKKETVVGSVKIEPAPPDVSPTVPGLAAVIEDQKAFERQQYAEEVERIRKTRKPYGASVQKLALPLRPNYHRHWWNDTPGRLDEAKQGGWTHITDEQGKPVRRVVGSGRDKGALYAYAMEIPTVFWEEDQQANVDLARAKVNAIKASPVQAKPGEVKSQDREKFYTPREIEIVKR